MVGDDDDRAVIECATYTHARRHPIVVGQIGGWALPVQLTLTQIGVIALVYLVELRTWSLWAALFPLPLHLLLAIAVPVLIGWLVRHVRIEGRSVPRAMAAWLGVLTIPREGYVVGRRHRHAPVADLRRARVYVAPGRQVR